MAERTTTARWLRTAEIYLQREKASTWRWVLDDDCVRRQLSEERETLDRELQQFQWRLYDDVSRVKRLVVNVAAMVATPSLE